MDGGSGGDGGGEDDGGGISASLNAHERQHKEVVVAVFGPRADTDREICEWFMTRAHVTRVIAIPGDVRSYSEGARERGSRERRWGPALKILLIRFPNLHSHCPARIIAKTRGSSHTVNT